MILFTSDLDKTLIFSNNGIRKNPPANAYRHVEIKDGLPITYMNNHTMDLLETFAQRNIFVPVTTRAVYQYKRIYYFYEELRPKYAITSNGGNLLIDGEVSLEWHKKIQEQIMDTSVPKEEIRKLFEPIWDSLWGVREFYVDNLFYVYRIQGEYVPKEALLQFGAAIHKLGWTMYLQEKKLYLLPTVLNKANAVKELKEFVQYDQHMAAGDSLMDLCKLTEADYGFSPKDEEIDLTGKSTENIIMMNNDGLHFSVKLLEELLEKARV